MVGYHIAEVELEVRRMYELESGIGKAAHDGVVVAVDQLVGGRVASGIEVQHLSVVDMVRETLWEVDVAALWPGVLRFFRHDLWLRLFVPAS